MKSDKRKVLIATGGTGGHIFPSLSLADFLKRKHQVEIVTDKRGLRYVPHDEKINIRIIRKVVNFSSNFYKLSLCGLVSLLIFQTFIHIGVNVNLIPTTGMTLPFLSYGGSSLLSSGIIAGILLNYTSLKEKIE